MVVRYMYVLVISLVMNLCVACSSETAAIVTSFHANAEIMYDDLLLAGEITCCSSDGTTLTLSSPEYVDGLVLRWDGAKLQTQLGDTIITHEDTLPAALPYLLQAAFVDIAQAQPQEYVSCGIVEGYEYRCEFDAQSGMPRTVSFQEIPIDVRFSQASRLQ